MTICRGGSWDGEDRAGYPHRLRKLVIFARTASGDRDLDRPETYIRATPGGEWVFAHPGATSETDGPWHFPEDA